MLTLYWVGFIGGGVFVALSVMGGLDGAEIEGDFDDIDFDFGVDAELDADAEAEHATDTDLDISDTETRRNQQRSPFIKPRRHWGIVDVLRSFKFWTFSSCFFGLTGLLLTYFTPLSSFAIGAIALLMGLFLGTAMATILLSLRRAEVDSLVRSEDVVGMIGTVEVPFDADTRGKVRLQIKGSSIDYIAYTSDSQALTQGTQVMVVGREKHRIWVVAQEKFPSSSS